MSASARVGVAAVGLRGHRFHAERGTAGFIRRVGSIASGRAGAALVIAHDERGDRPPRQPERGRRRADPDDRLERRPRRGRSAPRRPPAASPRTPPGTPGWSGPGRPPGSGPAPGRRPARSRRAARRRAAAPSVDEHRRQRLHALHRDALGELVEQVGQAGMLGGQRLGPRPDLRGQQQLAAGRRPQAVGRGLQGALVGDLEVADLLDRVAPELDPQRVLLGRREDVEDAAADRELAALLDQLDPGVAGGDQPVDDLVQVGRPRRPAARPAPGRRGPPTCGCSTARTGATTTVSGPDLGSPVVRVGQPAQHGQPPPDGVGARREPLVRQRLPGREVGRAGRRAAASAAPRPGPRPRGRWR